MPISALSDGSRQNYARGIHGLPLVRQIHSPGDLLNQHRGQTLVSQSLVHAKEVDLSHMNYCTVNTEMGRDTCDKSDKLPRGRVPDSHMPVNQVSGGSESPAEELNRVIESDRRRNKRNLKINTHFIQINYNRDILLPEHVVVVFDVILVQQVIYLANLFVACHIHRLPHITREHSVRGLDT